jgi:hypothetical protein
VGVAAAGRVLMMMMPFNCSYRNKNDNMNAIHIQYAYDCDDTSGAAHAPEQLHLFWDFPGKEAAHRTYLFGFIGEMGNVIKTIKEESDDDPNSNARSNECAKKLFQTYCTLTEMHMQEFDPTKDLYYKLPASGDTKSTLS